jgi:hypothetical protein
MIGKYLKIRLVLNYFMVLMVHRFKFKEFHNSLGSNRYGT